MPAWLISFLISIAIKFGMPWVLKKFPWVPMEVVTLIEELLEKLKIHKQEKVELIRTTKEKAKEICIGAACPAETKGLA